MKRMLCVWLPNFPIQRLASHEQQLQTKSVRTGLTQAALSVLYHESGNRAYVVLASRMAQECGICAGMPLAEAQALLEPAQFIPHDLEADTQELLSLAYLCDRFSPAVSVDQSGDEHCLLLDISGCAHLFGGESGLVCQLICEFASLGYFVHAAVADTVGAAWAIARYGHTAPDRRLQSLPVDALRVPASLVSRLREFDLCTIRQLMAMPRDALPSRFGSELTERIDQMFGQREEMLTAVSRPQPVCCEWVTDEPICHPEAVVSICEDLLSEILTVVTSRAEGVLRLALTLKSEPLEPVVLEVRTTQPVDSARYVMHLLSLKLEAQPIPEWLSAIHMEATVTAAIQVRQRSLFNDDEPVNNHDLQQLTDRFVARLGRSAVVRPVLLPELVPEHAVTYTAVSDRIPEAESVCSDTIPRRPLKLFPKPEPIEVISVVPGGEPIRFHHQWHSHHITRAIGPERIVTDWWQDTGRGCRDYYLVETANGSRFWIYRNSARQWFLHGVFE